MNLICECGVTISARWHKKHLLDNRHKQFMAIKHLPEEEIQKIDTFYRINRDIYRKHAENGFQNIKLVNDVVIQLVGS